MYMAIYIAPHKNLTMSLEPHECTTFGLRIDINGHAQCTIGLHVSIASNMPAQIKSNHIKTNLIISIALQS